MEIVEYDILLCEIYYENDLERITGSFSRVSTPRLWNHGIFEKIEERSRDSNKMRFLCNRFYKVLRTKTITFGDDFLDFYLTDCFPSRTLGLGKSRIQR